MHVLDRFVCLYLRVLLELLAEQHKPSLHFGKLLSLPDGLQGMTKALPFPQRAPVFRVG
jgi:hypothetical protein